MYDTLDYVPQRSSGRAELEFQPLSRDEDGIVYGRLSTLGGSDLMAVCTLDEAASEFLGVVIVCRPMLRH